MIKTSDFIAKCWLDHCRLNFTPSNSISCSILNENFTSCTINYIYFFIPNIYRRILTFKILLRNRWTWWYQCRYVSRNTKQVASYVFYQLKHLIPYKTNQDAFLHQLQANYLSGRHPTAIVSFSDEHIDMTATACFWKYLVLQFDTFYILYKLSFQC